MSNRKLNLPCPANLSDRSQKLWAELASRHCRSLGRQILFHQALEYLDNADAMRAQISSEGHVQDSAKGKILHAHPLTASEQHARSSFLKLWLRLGLHWDNAIDSRINS